ncbi:MAG TPA: DUF3828 domain-containing protein [Brevundimonas sp.]|uniref:hypothetical protein n=1 Tax=Brevundimonas sp. TaxID=1871086 RepID=UPI002BE15FC4|nr:hypothetical protein [Brevundimonas sp.]HRH19417.1 DUF3828 domain-containing protein [Brevundimonas sp.]
MRQLEVEELNMRLVLLATAAVLALTACDPTAQGDTPAVTEAPAEPAAQATGPDLEPAARPEVGPETFARELYTAIFEDEFSPLAEDQARLWTPEAWADIQAAWARDPGAISADPFCECQDPIGMSAGEIVATLSDPNTATVVVQVQGGDRRAPVTLNLKFVNDAWVVDDVISSSGGSFREALAAGEA